MRLTKSQSIVIAAGSILLFFGIAIMLVQGRGSIPVRPVSNSQSQAAPIITNSESSNPGSTTLPTSEVILNRFHRSEVKDGKKLWEVQAQQGRYLPESASIELTSAHLSVYQKSGETVTLQAQKATLYLSGQELVRAETSGGVKVDRDGKVTLETERATYMRNDNIVQAPGFVQIKSDTLNVSGTGLEVNLDTEEIKLNSEVSSVVQPSKAKEAGIRRKDTQ